MILKFDFLNKPIDLTRPVFDALVDVVMLPISDNDTLDLMDAEIEGMLQLWNLRAFTSNGDKFDRVGDVLWQLTDDYNPINGTSRDPTGFVRFRDIANEEDGEPNIATHVLSISQLTIDILRGVKSYKIPANFGEIKNPISGDLESPVR